MDTSRKRYIKHNKIMYKKGGRGSRNTVLSIPSTWVKMMGITEDSSAEERTVRLTFQVTPRTITVKFQEPEQKDGEADEANSGK